MYYDLHIHSALSPCSDDLMTINNIFNMAYIKGLQLIAITDHNSLKQQYYLEKIIKHDILKGKIDYVHGVELQSSEEIHLLAYFKKGSNLNVIQEWIDKHLIKVKNQSDYYGNQYIYNEFDEVIGIEDNLLISSLDLNVYQIVIKVHEFNGVVILAHEMAKRYGIYEVYHGIPDDLNYDGIEVESIKQLNELKQLCKHLKDDYVFFNSDAHNLESISEPINQIDRDIFYQLWRK